jgi:hypothetical protein
MNKQVYKWYYKKEKFILIIQPLLQFGFDHRTPTSSIFDCTSDLCEFAVTCS